MLRVLAVLCAMLLSIDAHAASAARSELKVLISVDMEGIAGVVTAAQLNPSGFEYDRFRRFMTDEALAAVRAAKAAGATTILVVDAHGNGESLLFEEFPRDVRIVRSWPRRGGMVAGLDASFGAVVLIGYHTAATNPSGVRAHTYSSATFTRVAVNGDNVGEGDFAAAQAGELGVPTVFVSGDDATVAELTKRVPAIIGVETKRALSFHSAVTITPAESVARIEAGVRTALAKAKDIKPYVIAPPIAIELDYKHYMAAELMSYMPGVQRSGARGVRFVAKSMAEACDFLMFSDSYNADASP